MNSGFLGVDFPEYIQLAKAEQHPLKVNQSGSRLRCLKEEKHGINVWTVARKIALYLLAGLMFFWSVNNFNFLSICINFVLFENNKVYTDPNN